MWIKNTYAEIRTGDSNSGHAAWRSHILSRHRSWSLSVVSFPPLWSTEAGMNQDTFTGMNRALVSEQGSQFWFRAETCPGNN